MSEISSEDSFFDFKCPYCGHDNSFPITSANTLQDCASCTASFIVPEVGAKIAGKLPLPMTTPRLVIRRFRPDDTAKFLANLAQDESSTLMVNETNVEQWIEQQRAATFTRGEAGAYLAVEMVEAQELAGHVLIYYSDASRNTAGFALTIVPSRRRQGLGMEAARAALDFIFEGLKARRIAVSCSSQDAAACGLLEKLGLRKEGEFVKSWFDGNDWVNVSWFALLVEERAPRV